AMTASDDMSALFMARTAVEDARPDMVFLVKQHLSDTRYVLRRLNPLNLENPGVVRGAVMDRVRERHFEAGGETPEVSLRRAVALFSLLGPVHVEPGEGVADAAIEDRLVPGFPLWPVTDSVTSLQRSEAAADWRRALGLRHLVDRWGRAFLAEWIRLYGTREARLGQDALAIPVLRSALVVDPDDFRAAHNLAVLLAASGDRDTALDLLMSSVSINPGYVKGWETLSSTAAAAGRDTIARDAASRAAALRPAR
ncbi:MAG TPA: tetratricopeptide repeat protein, partial [Myxococcota bacterium]|nr:tetratricopeptide repeat protein [Myxococcota bacterium]